MVRLDSQFMHRLKCVGQLRHNPALEGLGADFDIESSLLFVGLLGDAGNAADDRDDITTPSCLPHPNGPCVVAGRLEGAVPEVSAPLDRGVGGGDKRVPTECTSVSPSERRLLVPVAKPIRTPFGHVRALVNHLVGNCLN